MKFEDFNLDENIIKALYKLGYQEPLEVQEKVIPFLLKEKDVIVKSQTGSGKTASFAIPVIQNMVWDERAPQVLVLTPTRELALQIKDDFDSIGAYKRLKSVVVFGKQPYDEQTHDLKQRTHSVIGTPGRVLDHLERGTLNISMIKYLIIDEADEMLNMGFIESVSAIMKALPNKINICLFSATMPDRIKELASKYMYKPEFLELKSNNDVTSSVEHYAYEMMEHEKIPFLEKLLCHEIPDSCIIFCKTHEHADEVCNYLNRQGVDVDKIHGGMLQGDRIQNMDDFRKGKLRILVATDVAARGIDIKDISHIINYDMPNEKETYIHRIGRAGRVDASGVAISLIAQYDGVRLKELESFLGYPIEVRDKSEIEDERINSIKLSALGKREALKADKHEAIKNDITKIYLNGGKSKKIRAGDIVGAICEIEGISSEDIGVIQIQDNQSYVDILNDKGNIVLKALKDKTIKGKVLRVEKAKTNE